MILGISSIIVVMTDHHRCPRVYDDIDSLQEIIKNQIGLY